MKRLHIHVGVEYPAAGVRKCCSEYKDVRVLCTGNACCSSMADTRIGEALS